MSREIKFRAWDKHHRRMFNIQRMTWNEGIPVEGEMFELMQYTGLRDKNGKEIYEGDILRVWWNSVDGKDIGGVGIVCFGNHNATGEDYYSNPSYGWYIDWNGTYSLVNIPGEIEVIGNIYENPNLIKETKE